jgi:NAD(P)H-hydrate repair Nnr-like enzyme with NAD(P)H-hydrate dehydratase domain
MSDYWIKQSDEAAFPDLLWSRPETKKAKGKLLIIGGNSFGFSAPGQAYKYAQEAGAGTTRVLLPAAVKKVAGSLFPEIEFGASNPSGSFSQQALGEWLDHSMWADGVLVAGDLGRNSETAILIEKYLDKFSGPVTFTKDGVDYFVPLSKTFVDRPDTSLVLSMAQLQKLAVILSFDIAFRLGTDLVQLVDTLHAFTAKYRVEIIVKHLENIVVGVDGKVSTTRLTEDKEFWRVETAAKTAVWRIQNPTKSFEAITSSLL